MLGKKESHNKEENISTFAIEEKSREPKYYLSLSLSLSLSLWYETSRAVELVFLVFRQRLLLGSQRNFRKTLPRNLMWQNCEQNKLTDRDWLTWRRWRCGGSGSWCRPARSWCRSPRGTPRTRCRSRCAASSGAACIKYTITGWPVSLSSIMLQYIWGVPLACLGSS